MAFYPASEVDKQEVLNYAKENLTIEDAKKILEKNGYFVGNLWHVEDVMNNYQCDEDTAQGILYNSLTNDYTFTAINDSIAFFAEELNL